MLKIGNFNNLIVAREEIHGVYLESSEGDILLPQKEVTPEIYPGKLVRVFIYTDSEDRLIATTRSPKAQVGEFAYLECTDTVSFGAFLDWGLEKDLFVPIKGQKARMRNGEKYIVRLLLDQISKRILAVSRIKNYLHPAPENWSVGSEVELLITDFSHIGALVIIDNMYQGLIYRDDQFQRLEIGQKITGYVKRVRSDGKVDVIITKPGLSGIMDSQSIILNELEKAHGFLPIHDKSHPNDISNTFHMSKKLFKKTIGSLYKAGKIHINDMGIRLLKEEDKRNNGKRSQSKRTH